jgi:AraC-like DNA-binding protein
MNRFSKCLAVWGISSGMASVVGAFLAPRELRILPTRQADFYGFGDVEAGGRSNTRLEFREGRLRATMDMEFGHPTPYAGFGVDLKDARHPRGVDFTRYDRLEVEMRSPTMRNVGFQIITWVDGFPRFQGDLPGLFLDLAAPVANGFANVALPLAGFSPSSWWPQTAGMDANVVPVHLDLVERFEIRVPIGAQPIRHDTLEIRSLRLVGRELRPLIGLLLLAGILSGWFTWKTWRAPSRESKDPNRPALGEGGVSHPPPRLEAARVDLPNRSELELQALLRWIGQNYHRESILVEDAARGCGLPVRRIPQLLKEHGGKNFPAYIASVRVAEACRLLRETDRQVGEIGLAVGFSNTSHFHRVFKSETGESPASWRESSARNPPPDPLA